MVKAKCPPCFVTRQTDFEHHSRARQVVHDVDADDEIEGVIRERQPLHVGDAELDLSETDPLRYGSSAPKNRCRRLRRRPRRSGR